MCYVKENITPFPTSLCVSFLICEINSSNKFTELLTTYARLCTRTKKSTVSKIDRPHMYPQFKPWRWPGTLSSCFSLHLQKSHTVLPALHCNLDFTPRSPPRDCLKLEPNVKLVFAFLYRINNSHLIEPTQVTNIFLLTSQQKISRLFKSHLKSLKKEIIIKSTKWLLLAHLKTSKLQFFSHWKNNVVCNLLTEYLV